MKKALISLASFLAAVSFSGMAGAAPISFTDTTTFSATGTNAPEDLVSYNGERADLLGDALVDWVTWEHQFVFDPVAGEILSGNLMLTFADDKDNWFEKLFEYSTGLGEIGAGWAEDGSFALGEVDTGTYGPYNLDVAFLDDGKFRVTVAASCVTGDFYIKQSDLTVTYNPAPVPEPATMLLLGTGLAGLAGVARRKAFRKK